MTPPYLLLHAARGEAQKRVLPHRLYHREPRLVLLGLPDKALVHERRDPFEHRPVDAADGLGRRERAAAGKDAELREEPLLVLAEQVVAPVERGSQRLLVLRRVAAAAGQELEAVAETGEHRGRRQELRPGRGELDRERQAVEAGAEL